MTVDEIEPINVQNWQLELAKEFSPNYIRIVQGMLSIAFDRAVVLDLAKKNPSRMIGNIPTSKHTLPRALEKLAGLAGVHRIKIHALRHPYVKP